MTSLGESSSQLLYRVASSFNTSFEKELHRVIFHGALHLCGYKDKTKGERVEMRTLEEKYLNQYFISRETLR